MSAAGDRVLSENSGFSFRLVNNLAQNCVYKTQMRTCEIEIHKCLFNSRDEINDDF